MAFIPSSSRLRSRPAVRRPGILLFCLAFLISACRQTPVVEATAEERFVAGVILNASRADSLSGWERQSVGREPIMDYTMRRTAVVLPPGVNMTGQAERSDNHIRYEVKPSSGNRAFFFAASAAAVAPDGYFLTAAHCLDEGACTLAAIGSNGSLHVVPARVVWSGRTEKGGPDIGLVHAPVTLPGIFFLADCGTAATGTAIFTGGFGAHSLPEIRASASGGHIVHADRLHRQSSGACWRLLSHNAPITPGDSGGPLLDARGRLLGINTEVRGRWNIDDKVIALTDYTGVAVAPDPAWIYALIKRDRATRG